MTPPPPFEPPDQATRHAIETVRQPKMFVNASAGSGKTHLLVSRVCNLISDGAAIDSIAAITFTEKAAAELRTRIREELTGLLRTADDAEDGASRVQITAALDGLDAAAIGTVHGFARRLLAEFGVAAGMPPNFDIADEVISLVKSDTKWHNFLSDLYRDPQLDEALRILSASGVKPDHLRVLYDELTANWDLIDSRLPTRHGPIPPIDIASARAICEQALDLVDLPDTLAPYQQCFAEALGVLTAADSTLEDKIAITSDDVWKVVTNKLPNPGNRGGKAHADSRALLLELSQRFQALTEPLGQTAIEMVATQIGGAVLEAAKDRQTAGHLQFHDLLVLARQMLVENSDIASAAAQTYQHLCLDEFQDTDPIQLDIARAIFECGQTAGLDNSLFVVGDPKQSIYRFRRADIATYLVTQSEFGDTKQLSTSFRSTPAVIDWVNSTFSSLIQPVADAQSSYSDLVPIRQAPPSGPGAVVFGGTVTPADATKFVGEESKASAAVIRQMESAHVGDLIVSAINEGWSVEDVDPSHDANAPEEASPEDLWRSAGLSDICILIPTRACLPHLEHALRARNIAYQIDSSVLSWAATEVREAVSALRAVDDPNDRLSLLAALRSSLFACGDDDLADYVLNHGGSIDLRTPIPDTVDAAENPVAESLIWLANLRSQKHHLEPAVLVERLLDERFRLELSVLGNTHRTEFRRLRFLADTARRWTESGDGTLTGWLRWVQAQSKTAGRVPEAILPETDHDAVRIMTVHAAKGMQFPICVVAGASTLPSPVRSKVSAILPRSGPFQIRMGALNTPLWDETVELDQNMGHLERIRLAYVAATRARDHLLVSAYHAQSKRSNPEKMPIGQVLYETVSTPDGLESNDADSAGDKATDSHAKGASVSSFPAPIPPASLDNSETVGENEPLDLKAWTQERSEILSRGAQQSTVSATALAAKMDVIGGPPPGLFKMPRSLELPPWLKGRYGTNVGRAVHGALQDVNIFNPDRQDLDSVVAAHSTAENVPQFHDEILKMVRIALRSEVVQEAADSRHHKELYVAAPIGDGPGFLLEGYLDLVFERDDGLVIVDYKTDSHTADTSASSEAHRRETYFNQLAAYAAALKAVTSKPILEAGLLYLSTADSIWVPVPQLSERVAYVRDTAAAEAEAGQLREPFDEFEMQ